jgi:hypothetical protein
MNTLTSDAQCQEHIHELQLAVNSTELVHKVASEAGVASTSSNYEGIDNNQRPDNIIDVYLQGCVEREGSGGIGRVV